MRPRAAGHCLLAAVTILQAACGPGDGPQAGAADPVVVYAGYEDAGDLRELFTAYTRESGTPVILRFGAAGAIVDDLIANRIDPPADLLLTPTVNGVYRAGYAGALRPVPDPALAGNVPARLRDPDGFWLPFGYRRAAIAYDPNSVAEDSIGDFASLAGEPFRGKLCLSSSAQAVNRAVIAALINDMGTHDAEVVVRGWVANLARPVFAGDAELAAAIAAGECGLGILTARRESTLPMVVPDPPVVDIEGVGIGRHARNPEGADAVLEWLLSESAQADHARASGVSAVATAPGGTANVGVSAWYADDAARLAERARYEQVSP